MVLPIAPFLWLSNRQWYAGAVLVFPRRIPRSQPNDKRAGSDLPGGKVDHVCRLAHPSRRLKLRPYTNEHWPVPDCSVWRTRRSVREQYIWWQHQKVLRSKECELLPSVQQLLSAHL